MEAGWAVAGSAAEDWAAGLAAEGLAAEVRVAGLAAADSAREVTAAVLMVADSAEAESAKEATLAVPTAAEWVAKMAGHLAVCLAEACLAGAWTAVADLVAVDLAAEKEADLVAVDLEVADLQNHTQGKVRLFEACLFRVGWNTTLKLIHCPAPSQMPILNKAWREANLDPSIQKYLHQPLPVGKGAIYAGYNVVTTKAYIGKHAGAGSVWKTRIASHIRGRGGAWRKKGRRQSSIHNSIKKHSPKKFRWCILCVVALHIVDGKVDESDLNNAEVEQIAKHDTFKNGYNETVGGEASPMLDPLIRIRHKEGVNRALANPQVQKNRLEGIKKGFSKPGAFKRKSDGVRKGLAKMTAHKKSAWITNIKAAMATDESKSKRSVLSKAAWATKTDDERRRPVSQQHSLNISAAGKAWWAAADDLARQKRSAAALSGKNAKTRNRLLKARQEALPYEPIMKNRIHNRYYVHQNGVDVCVCNSFLGLKVLGPLRDPQKVLYTSD